MAFTPTDGNDIAYLVGPGTLTVDFLGGVDTLDMGTASRSNYSITANVDGYIHIDSISGASSQATLHLKAKNLELLVWHDGTGTTDLRTLFDITPPTLIGASPADKASGVAVASNIVFTFSEAIQKGSGNIVITDAGGATVGSYAVSSSAVTVSGSTLTLNPSTDLAFNGSYKVALGAGTVKDTAGNALAASSSISFTTGTDPLYTGTAGNDLFNASAGKHVVDGGAGLDTLNLGSAVQTSFLLTHSGNSWALNAKDGSSGYTLSGVERLQFGATSLALDLDGHAGQTAKVLGALFGADTVSNPGYVGVGLKLLDGGTSYEGLMQLALDALLGPGASNKAVVDLLYTRLVGSAPAPDVEATFVGLLDNHSFTQAGLAVAAADTDINLANIHLAGLIDTGLAYIPLA
jgi:hypothetical protein